MLLSHYWTINLNAETGVLSGKKSKFFSFSFILSLFLPLEIEMSSCKVKQFNFLRMMEQFLFIPIQKSWMQDQNVNAYNVQLFLKWPYFWTLKLSGQEKVGVM